MSGYTFQKGDTGLTRDGRKFEVVADVRPRIDKPPRLLVVVRNDDGTDNVGARDLEGRWHYDSKAESALDLIAPTKKVWVIRAEITYNGPATAISWEYNDAQAAQNTFKQLTREGVVGYKNATIEEKEVPCQRSTS